MSRADKISDEAADWLIRLETGSSPGLWDGLQAWLESDAHHRAAFVRLRVAWHRLDALKNMRPLDGTVDCDLLIREQAIQSLQPRGMTLRARDERPSGPRALRLRRRWLAATGVAAAAAVAIWLIGRPSWQYYDTAIGGRDEVTLQDGTRIQLNTNTALRVRLEGTRREVSLLHGEALFYVTRDPARPFAVAAGHMLVRAVGTEFSVRIRDPAHISVMVADGRVAVSELVAMRRSAGPDAAMSAELSAGESAETGQRRISVKYLPSSELVRRLAWTSGHLSFQGETLEEATREFNRYNHLQIVIKDPSIARLQVGGVFLARDPLSFIAALQRSFGIEVERSGDEVHLLPGADKED